MIKPKRVWTRKIDFTKFGFSNENHPIYEYRGYFIARSYAVANTPSSVHFEIYDRFEDGFLHGFNYHLNRDNGQKRLREATGIIDGYLDLLTRQGIRPSHKNEHMSEELRSAVAELSRPGVYEKHFGRKE